MAKKSRTPPPPRRVQAPKQRHAPRKGMDPARQRMILYGVAGAGLVGLAVVVIVLFAAGGGNGSAGNPAAVADALQAAGCTLSTSKAGPSAQHTTDVKQSVTYSTFPPTSGRHYYQPAIWGNYTQPVDPRVAVHNLEHGGIDIWVGPDVPAAERQQISDFYDESPDAMLVTPIENTSPGVKYPKHAPPGSKVYLTAWTVDIKNGNVTNGRNIVATCPRFDRDAFAAFRDEFRGKGPERYPLSQLAPGT